jgi:hypothetical protein
MRFIIVVNLNIVLTRHLRILNNQIRQFRAYLHYADCCIFFATASLLLLRSKGPYRPDAIWQRDANFQFSMTFNFTIFLCFSNIRNHLSNFSYLVCISCKICIRGRSFFLKTENPHHVRSNRVRSMWTFINVFQKLNNS